MTNKNSEMGQWKKLSDVPNDSESGSTDLDTKLDLDLQELLSRLNGSELIEAIIGRVKCYVVQSINRNSETELEEIQEKADRHLSRLAWQFITDEHREFVVQCHARGMSTSAVVMEIIQTEVTIWRFAQPDALGLKRLRSLLIHGLSYLKPGTTRWPENKYGKVWREARETYKQAINDVPFTSSVEQIATLSKHVERINDVFSDEKYTVKELATLTISLTRTLEGIRKLTAVEQPPSENLSGAQLVAVLERLTVALDTPDQLALSGDTDALVSVLEQLTLALKTSGQKVLGEKSVQDAEVVSAEGGDSLQ